MGYVVQTALPAAEPISLAVAKNYLRVDADWTGDDQHISGLISAAREYAERITGKCLAQRTMRQVLDSMPYYTDTIQSQLAYPPSYYSLPRYSTTLWNYSQMIKLFYPPVISVQRIRFIAANGNAEVLDQDTDFILDRISQPARIFPVPGQFWPPNYYTPNSCEIDYTAGYLPAASPGTQPDTHTVGAAAYNAANIYAPGDIVSYTSDVWTATEEVPANCPPGTNDPSGNAYWAATALGAPGQQPDSVIVTAIPHNLVRIMLGLINAWYDNRSDVDTQKLDAQLYAEACIDFQPTRG